MLKKILLWSVGLLVLLQFISVDKTNPKSDPKDEVKAPNEVMSILKKSCYDCHSNQTQWPWYSEIAPISFVVSSHVKKARKAINFSSYNTMDLALKQQRLKRAIMTVENERMALPSYVSAHKEAKLSKAQKVLLTQWFKSQIE